LLSEPTRVVPSTRTLVEDWPKVLRPPNLSMSHCWQRRRSDGRTPSKG
jgi:hypothetical protein